MHSLSTEVPAAILILFSLVKLTVVLVNAREWIRFATGLYANPRLTSFVFSAVAGVILYLVIRSGLDIVQTRCSLFIRGRP